MSPPILYNFLFKLQLGPNKNIKTPNFAPTGVLVHICTQTVIVVSVFFPVFLVSASLSFALPWLRSITDGMKMSPGRWTVALRKGSEELSVCLKAMKIGPSFVSNRRRDPCASFVLPPQLLRCEPWAGSVAGGCSFFLLCASTSVNHRANL